MKSQAAGKSGETDIILHCVKSILKRLVEAVRKERHRAVFGIVGAKTVPRVLAANGFADDAYQRITQEEDPGLGNWVKQGATSRWETWDGTSSQNHIMLGDISAWMYEYPKGISPFESSPGFRRLLLSHCMIKERDYVRAEQRSPHGRIVRQWKKLNGDIHFYFEIPDGTSARFTAPVETTKIYATSEADRKSSQQMRDKKNPPETLRSGGSRVAS